ncbi:hypothetical protein ACLOJK_027785 [Asimina triloba]
MTKINPPPVDQLISPEEEKKMRLVFALPPALVFFAFLLLLLPPFLSFQACLIDNFIYEGDLVDAGIPDFKAANFIGCREQTTLANILPSTVTVSWQSLYHLNIVHGLFGIITTSELYAELYVLDSILDKVSQSLKLRRYNEALEDLNDALKADRTLSDAYLHRASALRQLCRFEESEEDYKKFLQLKPGTSAAEKELSQLLQAKSAMETAYSLFNSGDFAKALEYIDKVVLVFSLGCKKAKFLKIKLLIAIKDYSTAITESGYLLKEDETDLEALLLRGRAYYYLADHDVAMSMKAWKTTRGVTTSLEPFSDVEETIMAQQTETLEVDPPEPQD